MDETTDRPGDDAVERLQEHLDDVEGRPEEMQRRLDELGEGIDAARRQAQSDDLLPGDDDRRGDLLPGDDDRREGRTVAGDDDDRREGRTVAGDDDEVPESPVSDTDFGAGG